MNIFGKAWKSYRISQRRTLRSISEELGLSIGYISDIEQGRKGPPDLETVRKYERIINIEDGSLVSLASRLRGKLKPDITQQLRARPQLADVLLRISDLPEDELKELIADLDRRKERSESEE